MDRNPAGAAAQIGCPPRPARRGPPITSGTKALAGRIVIFVALLAPCRIAVGMEYETEIVSSFELLVLDSENIAVPHATMKIEPLVAKRSLRVAAFDQPNRIKRSRRQGDGLPDRVATKERGTLEVLAAHHGEWVAQLCCAQKVGSDLDCGIQSNLVGRREAGMSYANLGSGGRIGDHQGALLDHGIGAHLPYLGVSHDRQLVLRRRPLLARVVGGDRRRQEREYQKDEYPQFEWGLLFVTAGIVGISKICSVGFASPKQELQRIASTAFHDEKGPVPGKARACPGLA